MHSNRGERKEREGTWGKNEEEEGRDEGKGKGAQRGNESVPRKQEEGKGRWDEGKEKSEH